jgi:phenazine biosynthesis protein phzE
MKVLDSQSTGDALLAAILDGTPGAYALLYRPEHDPVQVELIGGSMSCIKRLEDLPACSSRQDHASNGMLAIVPYRQITERGFDCVDDHEPLSVMSISATDRIARESLISAIPDIPIQLSGGHYDRSDEAYAETALRIIQDEIGRGAGANFVLKRSYVASITDYSRATALALYRRLLLQGAGAYWVFLVDTGDRVFIGATPERHVSLVNGVAIMNPVSGTYRYPSSGPTVEGVLQFLADSKENEELFMVVDEELKMMSRVCAQGATVHGPYLKPMARLAHTEYLISGATTLAPWEVLRETLFAPTITGSPLENACRVIKKYEPEGRGYYSGILALLTCDSTGKQTMDSSILIRTADIDHTGVIRIATGATLVRDSVPAMEAAETRVKAAGLLGALAANPGPQQAGADPVAAFHTIARDPRVIRALEHRNDSISAYWRNSVEQRRNARAPLQGRSVLVLDAEDTFTAMICHQLGSFGLDVTVVSALASFDPHAFDVIVLGPGPGNPNDEYDQRVAALQNVMLTLLACRKAFIAICLSHQILCRQLGLRITQKQRPNQGAQKQIDLFGEQVTVGFYNAWSATCAAATANYGPGLQALLSRDPQTHEVHAVHGAHFKSFQFHPESILTPQGDRLLGDAIATLVS